LGDISDYDFMAKLFKIETPDIVINGAAESFVDNSIEDSKDFVTSNIMGTHSILEAMRKVHCPKKFVQFSCYDEKTKAVTKEGLKDYSELKIGDIVFTINPKTNILEEQSIRQIIAQDYSGGMIKFLKPGVDMLVTPNHRIYNEKMEICEARECLHMKKICFPKQSMWVGENKKVYVDSKSQDLKNLFYLIGIYLGDGFTAYQEKKCLSKSGSNRKELMIKARDPKTGRFFSTGKVGDKDYSVSKAWCIFIDIPETNSCRRKVEKTLVKLGIRFSKHSGKAGEHLYFNSKSWFEFFDQFGKCAKNKFIPSEWLEYDAELLECMFNGLIGSDGHRRSNGVCTYTTISPRLKDGVCEIALKIGLIPNVNYVYNESKIDGRKISGWSWEINFSKKHKQISNKYISVKEYDGKIWCIEVKNKNFLVERNGCYIFSGNTDEAYGQIKKGSFTENSPLNPRSPYSATKTSADLLCQSYVATYGLPIVITRCCNIFGSRQNKEKLIPKCITNILQDERIPVFGQGLQSREWIFIKDVFYALKVIIQSGRDGEIYNIGSGFEIKNIDLVKTIIKIMGADYELIEFVKDRLGHDFRYSLDCNKLKSLGWKTKYEFYEALGYVIEWYKKNTWSWK
jgi:dTDP-D-glucose 4,6-dehydratase